MKKLNILYWICTGVVIASQGIGSFFGLISDPASVATFTELGYPPYLAPFLGFVNILGLIAIVIPGYPRLKEWAYAGLMFDVLGAAFSIVAMGKPAYNLIFPFTVIIFLSGSYILYHKMVRLFNA